MGATMQNHRDQGPCQLCGRFRPLTFHHLIPRTCHSNKWFRKRFTREDMHTRGLDLCRDCHHFLHRQYTEKELGRSLNTRELLLAEEGVVRFVEWVRRKR